MSLLSKPYQIVLDRNVDTPGHEKYVVYGFNAVQKLYWETCLRLRSTLEVKNIDGKHMNVDAMTEKGEVIFSKECKRLLDLCDEIFTKGDKKHAKCEAKARLKHKYHWVNKEEDILFNYMKDVYKILNNQDKVTMKQFYPIICDPDLDKGFCDMKRIPCTCNRCVHQLYL